MAVNPCAKRVTPQTAYEVWQTDDGQFTYWVLKKYQSPEKEENPFARWHVRAKSPATSERGSYGDMYVSDVKDGSHQIANPHTHQDDQTTGKEA